MTETSKDYELFHYGVKGMKWGVRRDERMLNRMMGVRTRSTASDRETRKAENKAHKEDWKNYKKSTTRKERREDRRAAMSEKGKYLVEEAMKSETRAFSMRTIDGTPTLGMGKDVLNSLNRTGRLDVKYTNVLDFDFKDLKK